MAARVASLFVLLVIFLLNHVQAEAPRPGTRISLQDNAEGTAEARLQILRKKVYEALAARRSQQNPNLVRTKRQMHDSMTVTADRGSGVHWGGGGGNGNGGGNGRNGGKKSNSPNAITNYAKARAILGEVNSLGVLGDQLTPGKPPAPVLSVAGVGSVAIGGTVGDSLVAGIGAAIGRLAALGKNLVSTSPMGVLIGSIGYVGKVGVGSDKVPGRTPENFISVSVPARVMNLPDKEALKRAARESGVVNLPVRGELVTEKTVDIRVVRTPQVRPVKVVQAVRDLTTGLYNTGLPASVVPGGKLVTTPPSVPTVKGQGPLVNPIAAPPVTVHTGNVDGLKSTLVKPFPASEAGESRDVVLVYPDNSGMEPVYVMYNKPRKGVPDASHDYHPAPRTEEITGFPGLIPQKKKAPRQGGGGLRERWKDAKGRTIYEWDSRHGELEGYRATDGTHLGSFDPKTGAQREKGDPKRKLKNP